MHLTEASFYYGEFEYMLSKVVDWSGDRATPWGSAAHRTPPGSFALCESEATATTIVFCAKAKRQR